jgi:ribosomal protein L22
LPIQRATAIAGIQYGAIPEELYVKEIMVSKGFSYKKMRIMGRGRAGITRKRKTHVVVKVDKCDFSQMIEKAKTPQEKMAWKKRENVAKKMREEQLTTQVTTTTSS